MRIISEPQNHQDVKYFRHYEVAGRGYGWSIDCDQNGIADVDNMTEAQADNYTRCILGATTDGQRIIDRGVQKHVNTWREPAIGLCDCGEHVPLDGFTCTCEGCETDYNQSGQRLGPRQYWGEETGEHPADILRIS